MRRNLFLAVFFCFAATSAPAQNRMNGKWETDRPAISQATPNSSRSQSVQLEMTVDGDKASGALSLGGLGGTFYVFQNGKVTGNKVQFQPDSNPALPIWTVELVDDNTVTLYRGSLPLVGNNVLDLLNVLGAMSGRVPAVQSGPVRNPASGAATPNGQSATAGSIQGVTQDRSNALIPGVTVTATNLESGVKATVTTDDAGGYRFVYLLPGTYTLTASLSGFAPAVVSNLRVSDAEIRQNLTLELPTPPASVSPASCTAGGPAWCSVLHRAK
jgi:hypothetical protein